MRRPDLTENTVAAVAAAVAAGADWVELDARRSADDEVVLYHNGWTPDGVGVCERTAEELAALGLCRLREALEGLPDGVGLNVEVKNVPGEPDYDPGDGIVDLVAPLVSAERTRRPLLTSSFNPLTVAALTRALPQVPCGLIHFDSLSLQAAVPIAAEHHAVGLVPQVTAAGVDADGIAVAHEAGLFVMPWIVNDAEGALRLAEAGVDALCSDDPGVVLAALVPTRPA